MESHCSLIPSARNTHASPTFLVCSDGFVKKGDEQGKKKFSTCLSPPFQAQAGERLKAMRKQAESLISFRDAALLLQIINTSQSQITAGNSELGTNLPGK